MFRKVKLVYERRGWIKYAMFCNRSNQSNHCSQGKYGNHKLAYDRIEQVGLGYKRQR